MELVDDLVSFRAGDGGGGGLDCSLAPFEEKQLINSSEDYRDGHISILIRIVKPK